MLRMETRLAILYEGSNVFCVSPELAHWDEIEACFLLLNALWFCNYFQHSPGSSSNTYLNQTIAYLFIVLLLWQCFCLMALPPQPPGASVSSSCLCYRRWGWFRDHQKLRRVGRREAGNQIKGVVRAADLLVNCISHMRHKDLDFPFIAFLLLIWEME